MCVILESFLNIAALQIMNCKLYLGHTGSSSRQLSINYLNSCMVSMYCM